MNRWIIVEDRPWVMETFIGEVRKLAEQEGKEYFKPEILYYIAGSSEDQRKAMENNYKSNVDNFEQTTQITVTKIDELSFYQKIENYYKNKYIIFMDLNLTGSSALYFNERSNVRYAREKQEACKDKKEKERQIWFYTTGASLDANFLHIEFPDNVIEVINFEDGKVQLDLERAWDILKDGKPNTLQQG